MDLQWVARAKNLLYLFTDYPSLHQWLIRNSDALKSSGAKIQYTTARIEFPNGNILQLGHAKSEESKDKYLSYEYDLIEGSYNEMLKHRELAPRKFY